MSKGTPTVPTEKEKIEPDYPIPLRKSFPPTKRATIFKSTPTSKCIDKSRNPRKKTKLTRDDNYHEGPLPTKNSRNLQHFDVEEYGIDKSRDPLWKKRKLTSDDNYHEGSPPKNSRNLQRFDVEEYDRPAPSSFPKLKKDDNYYPRGSKQLKEDKITPTKELVKNKQIEREPISKSIPYNRYAPSGFSKLKEGEITSKELNIKLKELLRDAEGNSHALSLLLKRQEMKSQFQKIQEDKKNFTPREVKIANESILKDSFDLPETDKHIEMLFERNVGSPTTASKEATEALFFSGTQEEWMIKPTTNRVTCSQIKRNPFDLIREGEKDSIIEAVANFAEMEFNHKFSNGNNNTYKLQDDELRTIFLFTWLVKAQILQKGTTCISWSTYLLYLQTAFNSLPFERCYKTVYYMMPSLPYTETDYTIGRTVKFTSFLLTSTSLSDLYLFGSKPIFKIQTWNGRDVSDYSTYQNGGQILIEQNTSFLVIGKSNNKEEKTNGIPSECIFVELLELRAERKIEMVN